MNSILFLMMTLLGLLVSPQLTQAANKTDYYNLYDYLFENTVNYKKQVRPAVNETQPIKVFLYIYLSSIVNVDEKEQTLITSATLQLNWDDSALAWDSASFGGIRTFLTPQSQIYLPDLRIFNSVVGTKQLGFPEQQVNLYNDGTIIWEPNVLLVTSCDIDITYFPFDTQICYIVLSTASSGRTEILLKANQGSGAMSFTEFTANGQWVLLETNVEQIEGTGNDRSKLKYGLLMRRRKIFYMLNIVMPVFFLSLTSSLVFALPADEGEKMGTGITVLLAFAVYLTIVSEFVPNTSLQVSVLAVYLTTLLGMCAISVVVCAFILRLHFRDEDIPVGPKTTRATHFLQRLICSEKNNQVAPVDTQNTTPLTRSDTMMRLQSMDNENDNESTTKLKGQVVGGAALLTWKQVAKTMDEMFFIVFTMMSVVVTLVCMLILGVGGVINAPGLEDFGN